MPRVKKNPNRRIHAAMPKDHSLSNSYVPQGRETSGPSSMPSKTLAITWNNHKLNIVSVLGSYIIESKFVDVTIICEGQKIKAHQMVLSASSPYFHDIFVENPCQNPVLIIHGFKCEIIKTLVDFIYKGEAHVIESDIQFFLEAAELFEIKGLSMNQERKQKKQIVPMKTDMPPRKENRKRSVSEIKENFNEDRAKRVYQQPLSSGTQQYEEADKEIERTKSVEQKLTADNTHETAKAKTMPDVQEPEHLPAFGSEYTFPAQAVSGSQEVFLTENPCNFPDEDIRSNIENESSSLGSPDENTSYDESSQAEIICIEGDCLAQGIILCEMNFGILVMKK